MVQKGLNTKGYDNVTIQEICEKAGVSVGTFYNYFESKNEIFTEIYKIADNFFYETIKGKLTSKNTIDKIIRVGQERNEVTRNTKPENITEFLFILMRGVVYDWCLHHGKYDLKEKIEVVLKQTINTIKS